MPPLAGVAAQVPHDQEIPAEPQPRDQREFALQLRREDGRHRAMPRPRSGKRHFAQQSLHGLTGWRGKIGELVAEVLEGEFQPPLQAHRLRHRLRQVGEARRHLVRGMHVALGIDGEPAAGGIKRHVKAQAREDVGHGAFLRCRVGHAARGEQGQATCGREVAQECVLPLLAAAAVALHLDVDAAAAERRLDPRERRARRRRTGAPPRVPHRALLVAGQGDQALRVRGDFLPGRKAGTLAVVGAGRVRVILRRRLGRARRTRRELRLRDQAAEVPVARAVHRQQRQYGAVGERDFGTHPRPQPALACGAMETRCAGQRVAVEQRHRLQSLGGGGSGQRGRIRRAAEEAEGAARVQLDVARVTHVQSYSPSMNQVSPARSRR